MICPKCKSENQNDRFCGHCGNQLKASCPDGCGQWEPINRSVCEIALAEALKKESLYVSKKDLNDFKDFMLYLAKFLSLVIAGVLFLGMVVWPPIQKALIDFANK